MIGLSHRTLRMIGREEDFAALVYGDRCGRAESVIKLRNVGKDEYLDRNYFI